MDSLTVLNIAHFNDVYQVSDQKIYVDKKEETINVAKFGSLLASIVEKWEDKADGRGKNGLTVFSGDLFSPSIESSVTRGNHLPAIVNALGVDISVVGNHEFDFGWTTLQKLVGYTNFPWLLSNIIDDQTGTVPAPLKEFEVVERAGVRIGLIGLVEKDWIATIAGWRENFKHKDMAEVGRNLSVKLRDPAGEYKCDLIIALTHSRIPNDITLAKELFALSPAAQAAKDISSQHGVDLLLGGHDHVYWISKGVSQWDGYDLDTPQPDAGEDKGDVLIVKSGTDYQDLSEIVITLKATPAGSVRKQVIHEIKGARHVTRGNTPVDEDLQEILTNELGTITASLKEPVCITETQLDVRSSYIRLHESAVGNWVTDYIRPAYDEALKRLGYGKTDGVISSAGCIRADRIYEPGPLTLGDLMAIVPYPDPTVVVELDANALWDALENGLSSWPSQEGRFPTISGIRVTFDSSRPPNQRVLEVWLLGDSTKVGADGKPVLVDKEQVLRTSTRKYLIMCGEYMTQGGDGYESLKDKKLVIPAENGQSKSALIRKVLLGANWVNTRMSENSGLQVETPQPKTQEILEELASQLQSELSELPLQLPEGSLQDRLDSNMSSSPFLTEVLKFLIGTATPSLPSANASAHPQSTQESPTGLHLTPEQLKEGEDNIIQAAEEVGKGVMVGLRWLANRTLVGTASAVADHEDMGLLDPYERIRSRQRAAADDTMRMGLPVLGAEASDHDAAAAAEDAAKIDAAKADAARVDAAAKQALPLIHPVVDGRLQDVAPPKQA